MMVKAATEPDLDRTAEGAETRSQIKTSRAFDCRTAQDFQFMMQCRANSFEPLSRADRQRNGFL